MSEEEDRWARFAWVAWYLDQKPRTAARTILLPDFPKPLRVGHPRWLKSEVEAWALKNRKLAA